jgi:hypothetical protein
MEIATEPVWIIDVRLPTLLGVCDSGMYYYLPYLRDRFSLTKLAAAAEVVDGQALFPFRTINIHSGFSVSICLSNSV